MSRRTSVAIIGGGYYGCYITCSLARFYPGIDFVLYEKESELCVRASSTNQGQFHRGYMYTAKPKLVAECSEHARAFESEFFSAINHDVRSFYGIHKSSIVDNESFIDMCHRYELPLKHVQPSVLFGPDINHAYETAEKTINTESMRRILVKRLFRENIVVRKSTGVRYIDEDHDQPVIVLEDGSRVHHNMIINASFSSINLIHQNSGLELLPTKNDVFLHFMVDLPEKYANIAATVAVGNYCSLMPSNFRGSHLLAVADTRVIAKSFDIAPSEYANHALAKELFENSIHSCAKLIKILNYAELCGFTVGTRTEYRDPRTNQSMSEVKVIENHGSIKGYTVVLGGKISCLSEPITTLKQNIENLGISQNQFVTTS